jgi:hypothetical protein
MKFKSLRKSTQKSKRKSNRKILKRKSAKRSKSRQRKLLQKNLPSKPSLMRSLSTPLMRPPSVSSPLCNSYLQRRKNLRPFTLPEYKKALDACATPVQMCDNERRLNALKGLNTLSRECIDILKYNKLIEMDRQRALQKAETKNLNMQRVIGQMTGDYTRYHRALDRSLPSPPLRQK